MLAVKVMGYVPEVPLAGVPERVPAPLPLSVKVMPDGKTPVSVSEGVGIPAVVTVKVLGVLSMNVVAFGLVMLSGSTKVNSNTVPSLWIPPR